MQYNFNIEHEIIKGGETRFDSVKKGLESIESEGLVAIHDGVRPLVSLDVVEDCYVAAEKYDCAIPVIKPVESVRLEHNTNTYPIDREKVYLVQTPQAFKTSIIKRCYQTQWQPSFTDDASVAEFSGEKIHLVEGNRENIKITTPLDLSIAEILMNNI
jgi:2-C-methyl-D-erythritol 4-phosphate cytidylyltransferase